MMEIVEKKQCTGCSACVDICKHGAITLETDIEGFWYPKIHQDRCVDCGLCKQTCAVLHADDLKKINSGVPACYGAYHKDPDIRFSSTSGGVFSALANKIFDAGGYVAGAVYTEDFSVKHILTNKREDLTRLRSSKYLQSETQGLYVQIKSALDDGKKVLACGTPCQMASLRLYLGEDHENLIICDFVCYANNSPKVFRKYLDSLERHYGAKIVSAQAKNKELGWRALTFKAEFANGKVYYGDRSHDNYFRAYMSAKCCSRPSCYACRFRGFPRISDITLGDFWGIEKVDQSLDNNTGTSAVLLNSPKGAKFFEFIDKLEARKFNTESILPGNAALVDSLSTPSCDRKQFYEDLENLPFEEVTKIYFPPRKRLVFQPKFKKVFKAIKGIATVFKHISLYPRPLWKFWRINFLRRKTTSNFSKGWFLAPTRYTAIHIHRNATLDIKGWFFFGIRRIRGSRMESRLAVEGNGTLAVEGNVSASYGTDILVFDGAKLTFRGKNSLNQRVQIICMDSITIGKDVMIARDVVIRDNDGGHDILTEGYTTTAPITIGNHVWIGQGAMIMKGVTIGDGAVISAGAWVVKDVKPNTLVMGDPARAVRKDVMWRG